MLKSNIQAYSSSGNCVEDADDGLNYDSLPRPTILGYKLINNPYSVASMQQAALNLYGSSSGITENKWYVRFKPSNPQQLSLLDSMDIDLFDYPLDYAVIQEGDYYDDGVTPAEEIPWLYAVVNTGFIPPAGVQYELLQGLHVPQLASLEAEAFRITGNPVEDTACTMVVAGAGKKEPGITPQRAPECPPGYVWSPGANQCILLEEEPLPPPPPAPTRMPSGTVLVRDNNRNESEPVRNVRVIAKRFLKVERTYTNNQGQYFINKEFRKVYIYISTKNDQASIRSLRRGRFWQMLFPVEVHFGKFSGSLNNVTHTIEENADALSSGARHWAAASVHNNVQEYYQFAGELGIGTPPTGIKILLTNWRVQGPRGAAPMFAHRFVQDLPESFVKQYLIYTLPGGLGPFINAARKQVDVTIGYNMFNRFGFDRTSLSDEMGETAFHELTHAAHYNKVGSSWWNDFVNAELNQMVFSNNPPYGIGDAGAISDIIALGESWAYHVGHFLSDRKYGLISSPARAQFILYDNNTPINSLSSHINLLEDFNPQRTNDPDRWISQGLYYDLIDNRNDATVAFPRVNLNDNVFGYTNQQFFNALDTDIKSIDAFRIRLLSENGNNQAAGVNQIFTFYATW